MSLGGQLDAGLRPGSVRAEKDGAVAEVEVEDVDRLGARIRAVRVTGREAVGIRTHVERLPEAVRVLPDRVVPVEVAPELGGAVLRTEPGEVHEHEYFEVRTDGRRVEVERFRAASGGGREGSGFTLTREQLRRLVDDLDGTFRAA